MDFIVTILSHWQSVAAVLIVLGGLIFFHELGHFALARLLGIGVSTFSLGFGPKLWARRYGKTEYCLSIIPLGGYCALAGEEDEVGTDDAPLEANGVVFEEHERFNMHPAWHRLLVVLAGPVFNFILALLLYVGIAFSQGQTTLLPEIGSINADSPAALAGMQPRDRVTTINGTPVTTWEHMANAIAMSDGKPLRIEVARQREILTFEIVPVVKSVPDIYGAAKPTWLIGVRAAGLTAHEPLSFIDAVQSGTRQTWKTIVFTVEGIAKLFQRVVPLDAVGGPIMIAQIVGQQAQESIVGVLLLAALISINLGILNLLPIPVLDGGHIVFFTLEIIFRRPLSNTVRNMAARVGMAFLIALMVLATWNDIVRLFS